MFNMQELQIKKINPHLSTMQTALAFLIVSISKLYRIHMIRKFIGNLGFGFFLRQIARIDTFEIFFPLDIVKLKFQISSNDKYWLNALLIDQDYEREIYQFLKGLRVEFNFLDLGSNIGYWALMARNNFFCKRLTLVEANGSLIPKIKANLENNSINAEILHAAVVSTNISHVNFHIPSNGSQHAMSSLISMEHSSSVQVQAVNFDSLVTIHLENTPLAVVKMDLEGIEYELLSTSKNLLSPNLIIIYEEHGSDKSNKSTEFLLNLDFHKILFLVPDKPAILIKSIENLSLLKTDEYKGYNCAAIPKGLDMNTLKHLN